MRRAFQWDLARQVERLDVLLDLLPRYASWGYQELYLHLEDSVDYPSLPGVARADAYRYEDLQRLTEAATAVGIAVVPILNLLGHTQYLIKTPEWRDLNELRTEDGSALEKGQLCPLHPRVPELVERLLQDMRPLCASGKVHVGLDESFQLGKCPRCRDEVGRLGLAGHFGNHVRRIHSAVSKYGLQLGVWGDMLALFPEAIETLPAGTVVYDWYYYPFGAKPRLELHGFRDYDLAPALRSAGASWWACPMSGAFRWEALPIFRDRIENARAWWKRAESLGAEGFLVTSWEAYRVSFPIYAVIDAAIASLWLDGPDLPAEEMLARGFARASTRLQALPPSSLPQDQPFGIPSQAASSLAKIALGSDMYPFAGYFEWETNQRWDGGVTLQSEAELAAVFESTHRLAIEAGHGSTAAVGQALSASLHLRAYFAERALFIRRACETVRGLRAALFADFSAIKQARLIVPAVEQAKHLSDFLAAAISAADAMWTATRPPEAESQNQLILAGDGKRLAEWIDWLDAVLRRPVHARTQSPVFGERRLSFVVNVPRPCVQRVCVEIRGGDGLWREGASRHIIEFQAWAAAPDATLSRPFATGILYSDTEARITVRGPGIIEIADIVVSDGLSDTAHPASGPLGVEPPSHGLPDMTAVNGTLLIPLS